MPKSAFILMALEAAQQFQTTEKPGNIGVRLSKIQFLRDLPLSGTASEEGNIETHFALDTTQSQDLRFTISAATLQAKSPWEEYCCGTMSFSKTAQAPPNLRHPLNHNPTLLEHIESGMAIVEIVDFQEQTAPTTYFEIQTAPTTIYMKTNYQPTGSTDSEAVLIFQI